MTHVVRQRRLEGKTDYKARLALLKSLKPRLVVRKTNRYIIVQIVESDVAQDKTIVGLTSKALLKKGWPKEKAGSIKNLAACYLTGFLLGSMAKAKVKEAIFDIGMHRNVKKSRLYAVLKGAVDSGLKIPCNLAVLPTEESIKKNKDIESILNKIKSSS